MYHFLNSHKDKVFPFFGFLFFYNTDKLSNKGCSGPCSAGWYCPTGSIKSNQYSCGGAKGFCPSGSGKPQVVLQVSKGGGAKGAGAVFMHTYKDTYIDT